MSAEQQTLEFFDEWEKSFDALVAAFETSFSDDCVWVQKPLAVTTGPAEAVEFLKRMKTTMGLETIHVETLHLASIGGVVHTERVDTIKRADGTTVVSIAVAGVMEWQDGEIVSWREYFDAASLAKDALPSLAGDAISKLGDLFRGL